MYGGDGTQKGGSTPKGCGTQNGGSTPKGDSPPE